MDEQARNFNQVLLAAMDRYAERTCFQVKQVKGYQHISYGRFQALMFRMARYLQHQQISQGARVVIAIPNCLEWMVVYMATLLVGGVAVPLRPSVAPDRFCFTLEDSGASLVILAEEQLLQTVAELLTRPDNPLPNLKTILVMEQMGEGVVQTRLLAEILAEIELSPQEQEAIRLHALSTPPETLAAIYYTAGGTDRPKGAVFDHGRLLATMRHMSGLTLDEDDLAFTVVPWSFAASLAVALHYFLSGVANVVAGGDETLVEVMQQTSPTVTLNMPYFLERFYEEVMAMVTQMPEASREVFQWAVAKGREFHAAGPSASPDLRQEYARADLTFFSSIRGQIGGRMRRFYSTGAPLSQDLAGFFEAIGLPVLDVYSLTEAGGFPAISRLDAYRLGSCGQVAPGFEIRIADDGEVLVRGQSMMNEYWGWPEETQQVLDADGWLHTGDLGYFDQEGYLYLTGRKNPVMVLSTGRKVIPATVEEMLMAHPIITEAVVFGEGRPYVSALLVPDLEVLVEHLQPDEGQENEELINLEPTSSPLKWFWQHENEAGEPVVTTAHPRVKALFDEVVAQVNSRLDRWARIEQYSLYDQAYSEAASELARLRLHDRHQLVERFATQIQSMYPPAPQLLDKEITQVHVSPERMRQLLEKESMLDAWLADAGIEFLFNLAREKQIDAPSMVHICDVAASIAQMENEAKPLSTALIVGDPARINRILTRSEIRLLRWDHIRRMRNILITLAKMVDGLVLGYVVDKHGYVRGIRKLKLDTPLDDPTNLLLGPQFRRHAIISRLCDAVVFFVPAPGRQVRVFADGQLVGRYSNGDWSPESMAHVNQVISQLAKRRHYDLSLLQRVLRCAFQMSEENLGAIFLLGEATMIMDRSDAPEISAFAAIVSADVQQLTDRELINFAKQDGATVIDVQGQFRGCMVLLRPDANTQADIGLGKGARHSSAAKTSAEAQCLAITVSQDGPITLYDCGRRILSL
ncbi:MAG: AMP-binding protein [Anaerolineae bacterium]|nr:AMP-binding protein [Anaerolineae bacterium]